MSRWLLAAFLPLLLLAAGCSSGDARAEPLVPPWSETGAPTELQALGNDLLAYQGAAGRLPDTLTVLDRAGLSTAGPYGSRGFAYSSTGLGTIGEGWRLLVVDDRLRVKGKAWCVVRPPTRRTDDPPLRVVLVPLGELHAAAVGSQLGTK